MHKYPNMKHHCMHSAGQTHSCITENALCFRELKEITTFNKSTNKINDFRNSCTTLHWKITNRVKDDDQNCLFIQLWQEQIVMNIPHRFYKSWQNFCKHPL